MAVRASRSRRYVAVDRRPSGCLLAVVARTQKAPIPNKATTFSGTSFGLKDLT